LLWQLARRAAHKTKALLTATPRSRAHNPSNFLGLNNLKAAFSGGFFIWEFAQPLARRFVPQSG
jgi:hypothetical protein